MNNSDLCCDSINRSFFFIKSSFKKGKDYLVLLFKDMLKSAGRFNEQKSIHAALLVYNSIIIIYINYRVGG